jgi:hypothetical protein
MATKHERLALCDKLVEALGSGDESKMDGILAKDFRFIVAGSDVTRPAISFGAVKDGIDGTMPSTDVLNVGPKNFIKSLHEGFSNVQWSIQKAISEEDGLDNVVAIRSEWKGYIIYWFPLTARKAHRRIYGHSSNW